MLDTEFKQSTDCIQFVTTALKTDVLPQSSLDPDNNEVIMCHNILNHSEVQPATSEQVIQSSQWQRNFYYLVKLFYQVYLASKRPHLTHVLQQFCLHEVHQTGRAPSEASRSLLQPPQEMVPVTRRVCSMQI